MQVNALVDADNYAVIGGGMSQNFRIEASAHTFKIMSDHLYRNKKLAVVREYLCNAHDAHVAAGMPDRPVIVTLTADKLEIQDFGPGIPAEKMVDVFCTYFGSTKTADETQTGGFGLGCKAGFAYTNHFTVTNCHGGMKRVYAMTVGDAETDGMPACREMVASPCVGTGLTVSIPIQASADFTEFYQQIHKVARWGGMKIELNGKLIEVLDLSEIRANGYGVMRGGNMDWGVSVNFVVLYGSVAYPIDTTSAKVHALMSRLNKVRPSGWTFVFAAPPSSLAVTPSRESLSYDDKTIATLVKMMKRAAHELEQRAPRMLKAVLETAYRQTKRDQLHLVNLDFEARSGPIACAAEIADEWARSKAKNGDGSLNWKIHRRAIKKVVRDHRRPLLKIGAQTGYGYGDEGSLAREALKYHQRRLLRAIAKVDGFSMLFGYGDSETPGTTMTRRGLWPVNALINRPHWRRFSFTFTSITIAPSILAARQHAVAGAKDYDGTNLTNTYYLVNRELTPEWVEQVKAATKRYGIEVEVLEKPVIKRKPKAEAAPPPPSPPTPLYRPANFHGRTDHYNNSFGIRRRAPSIETPSAFMVLDGCKRHGKSCYQVKGETQAQSLQVAIEQVLKNVAAVSTMTEIAALDAKKVKRLEDVVLEKLAKVIKKPQPWHAPLYRIAQWTTFWDHDDRDLRRYAKVNRRYAYAVLGLDYKRSAEQDQAYDLFRLVAELQSFRFRNQSAQFSGESTRQEAFGLAVTAAVESFAGKEPVLKDVHQRPHLRLWVHLLQHAEVKKIRKHEEDLIFLIETHRKRVAKRPAPANLTTTETEVEEEFEV